MDDVYAAQDGEEYNYLAETQTPFSQTQPTRQSQHQRPPPSNLPPTWAQLIPTAEGHTPMHFARGQDEYNIGRNGKGRTACDYILEDKKISGLHARISRQPDDSAILVDMSTNGTWINGERTGRMARMLLNKGDVLTFGPPTGTIQDYEFIYHPTAQGWQASDSGLESRAGGLYKKYDLRGQIGKGSFATVKMGIFRETGQPVAVKIINKKRFQANEKTMDMLRREVEICKGLQHTFIASFIDYYEDETYMYTVLEYVDGGDLLEYVTRNGGLPEDVAQEVSRQVCSAVAYLHSQGVAHRDLKPDNLLMTAVHNADESPICKVTDFGLAKLAGQGTFLKTMCGTPSYLAPEVILQEEKSGYDFACDAWSIGVLVYAALANALPFEEDEKEDLHVRMAKRTPDLALLKTIGVSPEAQDFVARLMIFDPKDRMTCAQALEHPWLQEAIRRASSGALVSTLPAPGVPRPSPERGPLPAAVSTEPDTDVRTPSDQSRDSYAAKLGDLNITSPARASHPFAADLGGWDEADGLSVATEDEEARPGLLAANGKGIGQKRKAPLTSAFSSASSEALLPPKKKATVARLA